MRSKYPQDPEAAIVVSLGVGCYVVWMIRRITLACFVAHWAIACGSDGADAGAPDEPAASASGVDAKAPDDTATDTVPSGAPSEPSATTEAGVTVSDGPTLDVFEGGLADPPLAEDSGVVPAVTGDAALDSGVGDVGVGDAGVRDVGDASVVDPDGDSSSESVDASAALDASADAAAPSCEGTWALGDGNLFAVIDEACEIHNFCDIMNGIHTTGTLDAEVLHLDSVAGEPLSFVYTLTTDTLTIVDGSGDVDLPLTRVPAQQLPVDCPAP